MTDPLYIQEANRFQESLELDIYTAQLLMVRQWERVENALRQDQDAAIKRLLEIKEEEGYDEIPQWRLFQDKRYRTLLDKLDQEISKYVTRSQGEIQRNNAQAAGLGRDHADAMVKAVAQGTRYQGTVGVDFASLNTDQAERLLAISTGSGALGKILQEISPLTAVSMSDQLVRGVALGYNPRKTARNMRQAGRIGLNRSLLIATDQQNRHFRDSSRLAYKSLGPGLIWGYKRLAAKNDRTCLACLALDGKVYETSELMPVHPRDRCTIVPILGNAPIPTWESGAEWLARQPEEVQRKVMGHGRYEIWNQTGANIDHLERFVRVDNNPTWGSSAQIQTVNDSRRIFNIPPPETKRPEPDPEEPPPQAGADGRSQAAGTARQKIAEIQAQAETRRETINKRLAELDEVRQGHARETYQLYDQLWEKHYADTGDPQEATRLAGMSPEYATAAQAIIDYDQEYLQLRDQLKKIKQDTLERQRQVLYLPEEDRSGFVPKYQKIDKKRRTTWETGAEEFRKLVPAGLMDQEVPVWVSSGKRAKQLRLGSGQRSYHYQGEIYMGNTAGPRTVVHELGHVLELNPAVLARSVAFYNSRTAGEDLIDISTRLPWYKRREEFARPDHWFGYEEGQEKSDNEEDRRWANSAIYVGKEYKRQVYNSARRRWESAGEIRATELVSMGLEYLWADPAGFAQRDPDYFDFIYDIRYMETNQ